MAYVSQELKKKIEPKVKEICKKYGIKARLAVSGHSTLVLNVQSGKIDFLESYNSLGRKEFRPSHYGPFVDATYIDVNVYHYQKHFDGKALAFLKEVICAMNTGNHDNSDPQTDYFDIGWYISVNIGRWNKPYVKV